MCACLFVRAAYMRDVVWRVVFGYVGCGSWVCDYCVFAVEYGVEESYVFEHFRVSVVSSRGMPY